MAGRGSLSTTVSLGSSDCFCTSLTRSPASVSFCRALSLSSPRMSGTTTSGWPVDTLRSTGSLGGSVLNGSGSCAITRPFGTSSDASFDTCPTVSPAATIRCSASFWVMFTTCGTVFSSGAELNSIGPSTAASTSSATTPMIVRISGQRFLRRSSSSASSSRWAPNSVVSPSGTKSSSSGRGTTGASTGLPARKRSMSARIAAADW